MRRSPRARMPALATLAALAEIGLCTLWATQLWAGEDGSPVEAPPAFTAESTVDDYVRVALLRNPSLCEAFQRWAASTRAAAQVTSLPDPHVSYTYFVQSVETRVGPQHNAFSLSQTFPWWGKLNAKGGMARHEAERMWWKLQARRLNVAREVKTAYSEYAFLGKSIAISKEITNLLEELEPIAEQRVRGGASNGSLLRLQLETGLMRDKWQTLQSRRAALSARLSALLNLPNRVVLPFPVQFDTPDDDLDVAALRSRFSYSNPELAALRTAIQREDERVRLARQAIIPDATLGVRAIDIGDRRDGGNPPLDESREAIAVTLSFSVPLWFEKYRAEQKQAEESRSAAQFAYEDQSNLVEARLEQLVAEVANSRRRIALYRESLLPLAREALKDLAASYETARASLTDLLESERQLLNLENTYWRAVFDLNRQLADLEALAGGSLGGEPTKRTPPAFPSE